MPMPAVYDLAAPCFFGSEATLAFEVRRLGAQDVEVDVLTQNGLTVYTDLDKSGESEP